MVSQFGDTFEPDATMAAAAAMTRNPDPMSMRPRANFAGAEGLRLRLASATQAQAKNGANRTMKTEFSDWNQPAGITKCSHCRCAIRIALRKKIHARTGLLVAGKEQRAADEQHHQHDAVSALLGVESRRDEVVQEVQHGHPDDGVGRGMGQGHRVHRNDAGAHRAQQQRGKAACHQQVAPVPAVRRAAAPGARPRRRDAAGSGKTAARQGP